MRPRRELSSRESVRIVEYMYAATCVWKHARRKDSLAFTLNATSHLAGGRLVDAGSYHEYVASGDHVRRYIYHAQTTATDKDVTCGEGQAMCFLPLDRIRDLHKAPGLTVVAKNALDGYLRTTTDTDD